MLDEKTITLLKKKNRYHAINTEKSSKIRKFLTKKSENKNKPEKAKSNKHILSKLRHTSLQVKTAV